MAELGNLKVVGDSAMGGGTYDKVNVVGTLTLSDNIEANFVNVVGTVVSEGNIVCDKMKIVGDITLKQLKVREDSRVLGQLTAEGISAEKFEVLGGVICKSDFQCAELDIRGTVETASVLSAENLSIKSRDLSTAKEIGGKSLKVRHKLPGNNCVLRAESIEFDSVDIECVEAKIVRGKNLTIGKSCSIEVVEYTGELTQHPTAKIGKIVKVQ